MKNKKAMKVVIIVIAVIAGLIAVQALYQVIGIAWLYSASPKSELRINIENYIEEYNRSCDADKQIRIDDYYEGGPHIRCSLKFIKEISVGNDEIMDFFLKLHNDFGYDNLCNAETNSEFFRIYDEVDFEFEKIRMSYGDEKVLPDPLGLETAPEDIDVTIYGVNELIYFDPDTISKFKGTVYAFKLSSD